jgi:hypothetical protein
MFITIITDCNDTHTFGRQLTRAASLFNSVPIPVSIDGEFDEPTDLEAGFSLVDMLDASRGHNGVVLVNKAPRSGKAKKWKNGTPFGYFWFKDTLVVSSVDGYALSLIKKLGLTNEIRLFDIPTVMNWAKGTLLDEFDADYVINTQFRSFEFLPRVARWVFDKLDVPFEIMKLDEIIDAPWAVSIIDNFGNLKTTLLPNDIGFETGKKINLSGFGELTCYDRLKDLPNGETGIIIGSSGYKENRFLEIMTQGESAKAKFGAKIGTEIKIV